MSDIAAAMRWQMNHCPICERDFQVTPSDDYLIPACGCYDEAELGNYPCEECGIQHFYACKGRTAPKRRAVLILDGEERVLAEAEGDTRQAVVEEFFVAQEEPDGR